MTRRLAASMATTMMSFIIGTAVPAFAQYGHESGHYDYHPGHYDYHNGHYDYHPGHYDYHGPTYVRPRQSYVLPSQPSYGSPPRTAYFGATGHPHDHASARPTRPITYGGFSHIDDIAIELEDRANALCLELYYNYQHNPGFTETYREAYEILTTAKYIHGLEHAGNRDKLRQAAAELDGLFHHVEDDVARWNGHHHRQIGHGRLTVKLEDLEETLHHLMDDVGARPAGTGPQQAPPAGGGFTSPPAGGNFGFPRSNEPLSFPQ